jgi:DNA-binding response OmpR family regulator
VVESDPDLLRALTEGLQRRAVDVHGTGDPAEAIRLAQGVVPDLLVLDVGLPGDGGFRVAEWLRHHADVVEARVVVSSARELSSAQRARVRLGPTEFVNRLRLSPAALEQRVMAMLSGATGAPDRLPTTRS